MRCVDPRERDELVGHRRVVPGRLPPRVAQRGVRQGKYKGANSSGPRPVPVSGAAHHGAHHVDPRGGGEHAPLVHRTGECASRMSYMYEEEEDMSLMD